MGAFFGKLGTVGVWSPELRDSNRSKVSEYAATLDALGYRALWVPGQSGGELFLDVDTVLNAAPNAIVATATLNIWMHSSSDTAAWFAARRERHPSRLVLGLGASHASTVNAADRHYSKPLSKLRAYIDALEGDRNPISSRDLILAALGPKMLTLAAERTAGAHTYFVTTQHTQMARETMGPDAMLIPELKVIWDTEADRARATARQHLASALRLPNYTNNLRRLGFSDSDFTAGGSDRLVDAAVAWGSVDVIVKRINEHLDAGADHVCIHVLIPAVGESPVKAWSELAPAVLP